MRIRTAGSVPAVSRMGFKPSLMWNEDVRNLERALPDDARYRGLADVGRLALVGHSLGGYTVLGLGGAWPSWKLPGVRAILALTP